MNFLSVFLPGSDVDLNTGELKMDRRRRHRTQSHKLEKSEMEKEEKKIKVHFPGMEGKWGVVTRTVDMENGNPLRIWHEMGEPASLTRDQLNILRQSDIPHTDAYSLISDEKGICVEKTLMANAVVYVEITPFKKEESLGYHYPGICE